MNRKKVKGSLDFLRTGIVSFIVLAFFIFPAVVGFSWAKDVIASRDSRDVYSLAEIGKECPEIELNSLSPFEEPLLTFTFDDGWESIYSNALPVMEDNCINSTQYVLGDHSHDKKYLSDNQIASFQGFGHQIASHTMTHSNLATLSSDDLFWELDQSKYLLSSKFGDIKDFATPLGSYNPEVIGRIKQMYRSHRNTSGDPAIVGDEDVNLKSNFDKYNIIAYTMRRTTPDEYVVNLIDYAKSKNAWVVLVYHQIDGSDSEYAVTLESFKRHIKIVKDSGIKTPVMGDVLDKYESREAN